MLTRIGNENEEFWDGTEDRLSIGELLSAARTVASRLHGCELFKRLSATREAKQQEA